MGTVYKAQHSLIGRFAAVKVLHPELRNNREVVNRFFNEAKATTQIKHPGIVEIFDFGYLPSGDGYIVMEFLDGVSLARRMRKGKMSEGKAAVLLKSVCGALAAAHAKHIVHRDLKPDNIFLCPDPDQPGGERPTLLDFGIAKLSDAGLMGSGSATKTGTVMGTPTYMSPEQCRGAGLIDHRADLYALGCIFYELVCGVPPFQAEGAGALLGMHLYVEPAPPTSHEPSVSAAAESLILSLLDKDPAQRPQTAQELASRLAIIAQAAGWLGNNAPNVVAPEADEPDEPLPDEPASPSVEAASQPDAFPPTPLPREPGPVPTTLSNAASQSVTALPRSRSMRLIGALGLAAATIGIIAVVMATGRGDGKHAATTAPVKAAAQPSPSAATAAETGQPTITRSALEAQRDAGGVPVASPIAPVHEIPATPDHRRPATSPVAATTTTSGSSHTGHEKSSAATTDTAAVKTAAQTGHLTSTARSGTLGNTGTVKTSTGKTTIHTNDGNGRSHGANNGSQSSTKILIETDL